MPIYEHFCEKCEVVKEELCKVDEEIEVLCDVCGTSMHRIVSASGFRLIGSGFYQNDSRKEKKE